MSKATKTVFGRTFLSVACFALIVVVMAIGSMWFNTAQAQESGDAAAPESPPPEGQEYLGTKRCAPCHFEHFMSWKKDKHAKTFELLTKKYEKDEKCLECHSTGYGEATGFKDIKSTPTLAGTTCESCHGPGSIHEEVCKPFAKVKKLTPEQEKIARDSIWLLLPGTICISCHTQKAHQKTETPKELQTKK